MTIILQNKLDKNVLKKIENYMFYDEKTMKKFTDEWKENIKKTNCFLFNVFNNTRCNYYKFHEVPCWYCNSLGKISANSHSVFECIRYHRDIDILSNKIRKSN